MSHSWGGDCCWWTDWLTLQMNSAHLLHLLLLSRQRRRWTHQIVTCHQLLLMVTSTSTSSLACCDAQTTSATCHQL